MTDEMKTGCVGRFSIDVPEETEVEFGPARVDGINIVTFNESLDAFHKRLAERESEIQSMPDRPGGNKNLEQAGAVSTDNGIEGKIFVHSRTITEGTQGNRLEAERYRYEGVTIEALVHGNSIRIDLSAAGRDYEWIEDLPALVDKLVANPGNSIPTESGFCIEHAYIRDPLTADQHETASLFACQPSHPDIDLMLILGAGLKPDEQGLLERSNEGLAERPLAERMRIKQLRAAPRKISRLFGDELVERFVEMNDANVHSFWWEAKGTEDDVLQPHISFKMNTGDGFNGPVPSSLPEKSALALWDAMCASLRIRKTSAKPNTTEPLAVHDK